MICCWPATWGVNISGIAIILQMRERMDEMQRQMGEFVTYVRSEVIPRVHFLLSLRGERSFPSRHSIIVKKQK